MGYAQAKTIYNRVIYTGCTKIITALTKCTKVAPLGLVFFVQFTNGFFECIGILHKEYFNFCAIRRNCKKPIAKRRVKCYIVNGSTAGRRRVDGRANKMKGGTKMKEYKVLRIRQSDYSEYEHGKSLNGGCYAYYTTAYLVNGLYDLADSSTCEMTCEMLWADNLTLKQALACFNLKNERR